MMPKYVILFSVGGSARSMPIKAANEQEAREIADNGDWEAPPPDFQYEIADITEESE
jgi:hypothetical protein